LVAIFQHFGYNNTPKVVNAPNTNLRNRAKIYRYKIVTNILDKKLDDPIQAEKGKPREKFSVIPHGFEYS
jgi:hypothetical protein